MKARSETIVLIGGKLRKEGVAAAGIKPGHLVVAGATNVAKIGVAALAYPFNVVVENDMLGKTINDTYDTGDRLYYAAMQKGEECQVRIPANAAAITKGAYLEADATGCLKIFAAGIKLAQASEAVDNSANAAEAFINVVVI